MSQTEYQFKWKLEEFLAVLSRYYANINEDMLKEIIVKSNFSIQLEWSYDNLYGGIAGHAIFLKIPEQLYLQIIETKDSLQEKLRTDFNKIHSFENEFIDRVFIEIETVHDPSWRENSGYISRQTTTDQQNRIWDKDCFRVFLSHKSGFKRETAILKNELKFYGISAFVAHDDIEPTREWQDEIENALASMDVLVALVTDGFHMSAWTNQEIGYALGKNITVIPVKIGSDPCGFIGKLQAITCSFENISKEIPKLLINNEKMLTAFINAVNTCCTYENGNKLSKILSSLNSISNINTKKLIESFNNNDQIRDSYGFNGKNPSLYGQGLLHHLNKFSNNKYQLKDKKIQLTPV